MSQPAVKRQRNTEMLRAPSVRDAGMSMLLLLAGRASVLGLFPFGVAFFAYCFFYRDLGGLVPCYANGFDRFRSNL